MDSVRLSIQGLDKVFATPVLKKVNLSVNRGEVHGIVGENGAGKSTLANIVAGMLRRNSGTMFLDGIRYDPVRPADALADGVSLATQETSIIDSLTVAENIWLGNLPKKNFAIDRDRLNERASDLMRRVGLDAIAPDSNAGILGIADRQLLELAKALARGGRLLLLDEPTAALATPQVQRVHEIIAELAGAGMSIIYVSHRLEDVLRVADVITVLRDGRVVRTAPAAELSVPALLDGMTGQFPAMRRQRRKTGSDSAAVVDVQGITTEELPHHISFSCNRGEIAGLAGLAGSGRSALLRTLFGLEPLTDGKVLHHEGETSVPIVDPGEAVRNGMGFLGEDRQSMGLYPGRSVLANLMVPGAPGRWPASRIIDRDAEMRSFEELRGRLGIRCQGPWQDISQLSGGNQQKTLLARWLYRDCEILLLNEPTRGVDVATKYAIYELLGGLAATGRAILLASSEIEELMTVCDRILVLSNRRLVKVFKRGEWTEAAILEAAFQELTGQLPMAGRKSRSSAAPSSSG